MICHFCNSTLYDTATAGSLKETFFFYVCGKCQPHEIIYRELYNGTTNDLLADAIKIDEYYIIREHHSNETLFDKNHITFFKMEGIWKIPSTDINIVKQKLQIYTISNGVPIVSLHKIIEINEAIKIDLAAPINSGLLILNRLLNLRAFS